MGDYKMWSEDQKEALLNVCKKHSYQNAENVIVPEPYLPYVPKNWNGILVLAESQSSNAPPYWEWVTEKMPKLERMQRLEKHPEKPEKIGIGPWDDGTIKLALKAIFIGVKLRLKLEEVAVSNAVPWTRGSGNDSKNLRPDEQMQTKAAEFWKEIFDVWQPDVKVLVVLGNVAKKVMSGAGMLNGDKYNWLKLRLPSTNSIYRVINTFDCDDLQNRFPKVREAKESFNRVFESWQIFFACHAVSLGVSKFKKWFGANNPD